MALNTSADAPLPVGEVSRLIGGWINRLGAVWVEGQITQLSRRPGAGVVFLTLRDPSHDISVGVTCIQVAGPCPGSIGCVTGFHGSAVARLGPMA